MNNSSYTLTVISMMIIDLLLLARLERENRLDDKQRWIKIMFISCAACALSDGLCVLFEDSHIRFVVYLTNAAFDFSFNFVAFYLFYHMEETYEPKIFENQMIKRLVCLPIVTCGILLILSYNFGIIFSVDNFGNYARGPLYYFFYLALACIYIFVFLFLFIFRMITVKDERKIDILKHTFNYYLPLIIGSSIQLFFSSFPGSNIGLTLTMVFIFFDGLEEQIRSGQNKLQNKNNELIQALERANMSNEVIMSIARMYIGVYSIDLDSKKFVQIYSKDKDYFEISRRGDTRIAFNNVIENVVSDEYKDVMIDFFNVDTLRQRLMNVDTIAIDYKTKDDRWVNARFVIQNREENKVPISALYIPSTVTEEKQRELEYQEKIINAAMETKKANMAKTDFLRRMSHDIRTPINGIIGLTNIGDYYAADLAKQKECRQKIKEASGFLLDLVNNILDMNKLESGAVILEEKPFDLYKILKEVYDIAQVNGSELALNVNYVPPQSNYTHLIGSPLHVRQVLMNIVGNAVKYNKQGGSIILSCKEIKRDNDNITLEFVCKDTGLGMSEEFKEKAFEPFSQENDDARSSYTGTGLGLSITKQLVDLMGGELSLDSKLNEGTTFTYVQSFKIDKDYKEDNHEEEIVSLVNKNLLLVEDNELNMEIAKFMFEQRGANITCANDGKQALELFEKSKPFTYDLILMDVMMPIMNGYEATKKIRSLDREDNNVLIFAMSANAFAEDKQESKKAGMNEHLSKPLIDKDIDDALRKYLK